MVVFHTAAAAHTQDDFLNSFLKNKPSREETTRTMVKPGRFDPGTGFGDSTRVATRSADSGGFACCVDGASAASAKALSGVALTYAAPSEFEELEAFLKGFAGVFQLTEDEDRKVVQGGPLRRHVVARDAGGRVAACAGLEVVAFSKQARGVRGIATVEALAAEEGFTPTFAPAAVVSYVAVAPPLQRNGLGHQLCLHLDDVALAWRLPTLLMFPREKSREARQLCAERGLQLCNRSCVGTGCGYDRHPVFSSLPCRRG